MTATMVTCAPSTDEDVSSCPESIPLDALPDWLGAYCAEVAGELQVDPSAIATLALGALAHCSVGRYEARVRPGWREPATLYVAWAANPGERKSGAHKRIFKVLLDTEREQEKRTSAARQAAQGERDVLDDVIKSAQKEMLKADTEDARTAARTKHEGAIAMRNACEIPAAPVPILDDVTTEALAVAMHASRSCASIVSSEGHGFFLRAAGLYSKGEASQDLYLKAHAGESVRVNRIQRPPLHLPNATLSVTLAMQPSVLRGLGTKGLRGTGFLARFFYCVPPSALGARNHRTSSVTRYTREAYEYRMRALADVEIEQTLRIIEFSEGAREVLIRFLETLEPQLVRDLSAVRDWASKLAGAAARVAVLFHVADQAGDAVPWAGAVTESCAERAVRVARAFIPHAQLALGWVDGGEPRAQREGFEEGLRARFGEAPSFTKREVLRAFRGLTAKTADEHLGYLLELGVIHEGKRKGSRRVFRFVERDAVPVAGTVGTADNGDAAA